MSSAREAASKAFYECEGNNDACLKAAFDAYEATAGDGFKDGRAVKALEWLNAHAETPFGAYRLTTADSDGASTVFLNKKWIGECVFRDADEAKAAAQDDFETRIRSALKVQS